MEMREWATDAINAAKLRIELNETHRIPKLTWGELGDCVEKALMIKPHEWLS